MARLLVIHTDKAARHAIERMVEEHHDYIAAADLVSGARKLRKEKPDAVIVGMGARKLEGLRLLKYMRDRGLTTPTIVIAGRGAGVHQPRAVKLGAKGFLEHPVEADELNRAVVKALYDAGDNGNVPPPITDEELASNLTMLEQELNQRMKCFAGRNQVFLQSFVLGTGTTKPRVCLKCHIRPEFGMSANVYYEYIRDVCCGDPEACPAVQQFRARSQL